ncbi:MAG: SIR2 family protein [Roseburia sp.]|nr:SIR2 family protein [Roseburia sp.]
MEEIGLKSVEELRNGLAKTPPNKIVFWIGAGIDHGEPTGLPLGYGLTDLVLQLSCGDKVTKVIEGWEKNCRSIKSLVGEELELYERPRLETIIETVREFENHQIKKQSVMQGLYCFSSKEFRYNNEHYLLAQYLHKGANIVTTNYGDFIKKAYEDKYGMGQIIHENKDMHLYRAKNRWSSCIYHIHGISSDLETIGANLTTVKNSLPKSFRKIFRYWLKTECVFIFMGYSGLDSLDVNPFLKTFYSEKHTKGVYVRHSTETKIKPVSKKEEILLNPFEEKTVCPCLTSEFFSALNDYHQMKKLTPQKEISKWQDTFKEYAVSYSKEYSDVFILGLCYRLGLSITKILGTKKWIQNVTSSNIDSWYKIYYSFENAVITKQNRIVKRQGKCLLRINGNDELAKSDYEVARGNSYKTVCSFNKEMPQHIKCLLLSNKMIDWSVSTKINRYVEYIFFEKLKSVMLCDRKKYKNLLPENIKIARESIQLIIEGGYDCVIDIHQIMTAYRTLALCQSLLDIDVQECIKNIDIALYAYADVSSINGVVLTILYKAIILLLDYKDKKNIESLIKARNDLKAVRKLFQECGLKKYYKRLIFVYIFYIFVRIA